MKDQDTYKARMAAQLQEWGDQIDVLEARAERAGAELKVKTAESIRDLRSKQHAAAAKLSELNAATGEAWDSLKLSADKLWEDLKTGVAAARDKFR